MFPLRVRFVDEKYTFGDLNVDRKGPFRTGYGRRGSRGPTSHEVLGPGLGRPGCPLPYPWVTPTSPFLPSSVPTRVSLRRVQE